uniref:Uncharacterized protein n=1 Tax=Meloidogyne enterolobii TaxID=390850 RepID=A0A6V7WCX9_MELEN|nr:unnamed protein product [Meloidogyne enterolobii]CAD2194494.1 unnamed protein product [Meloidogyne enterolobii]
MIFKYVNFVKIKNKWVEICSGWKCCEKNCINIKKLNCINGNGFGSIINDENIKYVKCLEGGYDTYFLVYAENTFNKPQNCFNYSLYYFEIKCIFERELNSGKTWISIGLESLIGKKFIRYSAKDATIHDNDKNESFQLSTVFNNNDIFGCGLVYPPTNKEEFPYIFFTQNGKQIGKGVLLKNNFNSYKPYINLICYSVEANFGNDLEEKPFKYDISEHLILKEFF